jgi:hypothetical protein
MNLFTKLAARAYKTAAFLGFDADPTALHPGWSPCCTLSMASWNFVLIVGEAAAMAV